MENGSVYEMEYIVYFQWQDGRADQKTVRAQNASIAHEIFEEKYPGCVVSQVVHANSMAAERIWY